jgi:hypothetical protein
LEIVIACSRSEWKFCLNNTQFRKDMCVYLFYYSWFLFNIADLNQNLVQIIRDQLLMLRNSGSSEICLSIKKFVQWSLVKCEC